MAKIPVLGIPCGFSSNGLPIGLSHAAAWWRKPTLLRIGAAYQAHTDWHLRRAPLLEESS